MRWPRKVFLPIALPIIIVIVGWLGSGLYTVAPGEEAALRIFGEFDRPPSTNTGLHWWWPWPIGKTEVVYVAELRRVDLNVSNVEIAGYFSPTFQPTEGEDPNALEALSEVKTANVEMVAHYDIKDIYHFLARGPDPEGHYIMDAAETALREEIRQLDFMTLAVQQRESVQDRVRKNLQQRLDSNQTGIRILDVQFREISVLQEFQWAVVANLQARQDWQTRHDEEEKRRREAQELKACAENADRVLSLQEGDKTTTTLQEAVNACLERVQALKQAHEELLDARGGANLSFALKAANDECDVLIRTKLRASRERYEEEARTLYDAADARRLRLNAPLIPPEDLERIEEQALYEADPASEELINATRRASDLVKEIMTAFHEAEDDCLEARRVFQE